MFHWNHLPSKSRSNQTLDRY